MKKLNRVLAFALAMLMLLSAFAVSAFADDEATEVKDTVLTSLKVYKTLVSAEKTAAIPSETFYVQMIPADVEAGTTKNNVEVKAGISLTSPIAAFSFTKADKSASGSVTKKSEFALDFSEALTQTGYYRYEITEVKRKTASSGTADSVAGERDEISQNLADYEDLPKVVDGYTYYIDYDYTVYTVDLVVSNKNGNCVVTGFEVVKEGSDAKPQTISFSNTIRCANITIKKVVDDDVSLNGDDEQFDFYIMIPEEGDTIYLEDSDTITAQKYSADGTEDGDPFELQVKGTNIDSDVKSNGTHFTLGNKEYIIITAPISMIYKVMEEVPKSDGFTTTVDYWEVGEYDNSTTIGYKGTDPANVVKSSYTDTETAVEMNTVSVRGTTNSYSNTVTFTNTRKKTETGVNLDFVPYVVVLLLAAVGGALFVFNKKKKVR